MTATPRQPIPVATQIDVFFRDRWLCHLCHRPIILHLALKYAAAFVSEQLPGIPLAYWHDRWRRDAAPLLDELAASIDHVEALAHGGADAESNYAAVCARCNARKSDRASADYLREAQPWRVKGKHGEPTQWDGLSSLFVALVKNGQFQLTASDRAWYTELEKRLAPNGGRAA